MAAAGVASEAVYHLLETIGEGRFGSVWKARRASSDSRSSTVQDISTSSPARGSLVAVKKMRMFGDARAQCEQERELLAGAEHSGIVPLLDSREVPSKKGLGFPPKMWLVMPLANMDLSQLLSLRTVGLAAATVLSLSQQILSALAYIHERGIIHRDVKPANILLFENNVRIVCMHDACTLSVRTGAGQQFRRRSTCGQALRLRLSLCCAEPTSRFRAARPLAANRHFVVPGNDALFLSPNNRNVGELRPLAAGRLSTSLCMCARMCVSCVCMCAARRRRCCTVGSDTQAPSTCGPSDVTCA